MGKYYGFKGRTASTKADTMLNIHKALSNTSGERFWVLCDMFTRLGINTIVNGRDK